LTPEHLFLPPVGVVLRESTDRLATTDRAVHEIAVRAGFGSNARLCEVFKREMGMSPSEYREQRQVKRER
jgi:transcriptional regulator GlxA family with amidase domain